MGDEPGRSGPDMVTSLVLDALPDGIMVVEPGDRIVYANRSMRELTGSVSSLVGRCVDEFVPDAVRGRDRQLRRRSEQSPTQRPMGAGLELTLRRVDGDQVPVEVSLSDVGGGGGDGADGGGGDGGVNGGALVIAVVRDVSERRAMDRRLAAADHRLALVGERERIGRDVHDVILQRLFAMGMMVQAIRAASDPATTVRLDSVIAEIDSVITELRTVVLTLGSNGAGGALGQELTEVIAQSTRALGCTPALRIDGPVESVLSDGTRTEMIASIREALDNVARHAAAARVDVDIAVDGPFVVMAVTDDGVGPPDAPGQPRHGNGLLALRARAAILDGECELSPGVDGGARLRWSVPF